jgi:hypothetical protein
MLNPRIAAFALGLSVAPTIVFGDDDELEGDDSIFADLFDSDDDEDGDEVGDDDLGDDDLGDDEDDDDPLMFLGGKAPKKKSSAKPKVQRAGRMQPTHQIQVLPFPRGEAGATTVAANTLATVSARPQRDAFQVQRFAWASTTSPYFIINQLTVGVDNMMAQAGVVPAEIFSQVGVGVALRGFIAKPGIDVTLQCTNIDTVNARAIYASIIGAVLL